MRSAAGSLALLPVLVLVWGCNWPVLKLGIAELAPLTFRSFTLPFAALGLLAVAKLTGDSIRIPRRLWGRVAVLALFNIALWNGLVLFGLAQLPAGRTAILAYTMPIWSVLISLYLLDEPLSLRKLAGLALGMAGMALLLGDDIRQFARTPTAALLIVAAAFSWALGTVLVRKWQLPLPQATLSGWMILVGCAPLALLAPAFASGPWQWPAATTWFAILYNIFLAGILAHWTWFRLARTVPIIVSSMSSLPIPIVGVFSGMLVLGERPGPAEWTALALVVAAIAIVLWPPKGAPAPLAPDD